MAGITRSSLSCNVFGKYLRYILFKETTRFKNGILCIKDSGNNFKGNFHIKLEVANFQRDFFVKIECDFSFKIERDFSYKIEGNIFLKGFSF